MGHNRPQGGCGPSPTVPAGRAITAPAGWSATDARRLAVEPAAVLGELAAGGLGAARIEANRVVLFGPAATRAVLGGEGRAFEGDGLDGPDPRLQPDIRAEWLASRQALQRHMTLLARTREDVLVDLVARELEPLSDAQLTGPGALEHCRRASSRITVRALLPEAPEDLITMVARASTAQIDHLTGVPHRWGARRQRRRLDDAVRALRADLDSYLAAAPPGSAAVLTALGHDRRAAVRGLTTALGASHAIPGTALAWLTLCLAAHPDARARVAAGAHDGTDPAAAVARETLRLFPPAWMLIRRAASDAAVDGWLVKAGDDVLVSPYFVQRDGAVWDRADDFVPTRWMDPDVPRGSYLPFGAGPRICPAVSFADRVLAEAARQLATRALPPAPARPVFGVLLTPGVQATEGRAARRRPR